MPNDEPKRSSDRAQPPSRTKPRIDNAKLAIVALRVAWRRSDERKRMVRTVSIICAVTFLMVLVGAAVFAKDYLHLRHGRLVLANNAVYQPYLVAEGIALGGWLVLVFLGSSFAHDAYKAQFDDRQLLERERIDLSLAEDDVIENGSIDFIKLWKVTQRRIDLYHRIATQQSQRSFSYAQWAAGTGFLIIVASGIIALFARSAAAAVASAITGVAGGGLGAYIGTTFMRSQDVASAQLRDYFRQPLELSRYLASERLLSSLNDSDRGPAVQKLIEAIVVSGKSTE